MHKHSRQIAFLGFANGRVANNFSYGIIDIGFLIRVQALISPFEHCALLYLNGISHQLRFPSGTKGVASVGPSARATNKSRTKSIGRSGLSKAVLPTKAQNSICPAIVRRSACACARACSYKSSFMRTGIPIASLRNKILQK